MRSKNTYEQVDLISDRLDAALDRLCAAIDRGVATSDAVWLLHGLEQVEARIAMVRYELTSPFLRPPGPAG
ncbi:hypothetical protein A5636_24745 [Mycobacterium asiaticum]|uniref:Uncharacterized protein n=1 Tax=Mycobacterium asiaticum TaxID=1790 RepID=A0A1A3N617_MYCAS|nr:hypothetical protein A5636_24745 [Mycobacterium asiaticum]